MTNKRSKVSKQQSIRRNYEVIHDTEEREKIGGGITTNSRQLEGDNSLIENTVSDNVGDPCDMKSADHQLKFATLGKHHSVKITSESVPFASNKKRYSPYAVGKGDVDADEELKDEKSEIQPYADDGSSP